MKRLHILIVVALLLQATAASAKLVGNFRKEPLELASHVAIVKAEMTERIYGAIDSRADPTGIAPVKLIKVLDESELPAGFSVIVTNLVRPLAPEGISAGRYYVLFIDDSNDDGFIVRNPYGVIAVTGADTSGASGVWAAVDALLVASLGADDPDAVRGALVSLEMMGSPAGLDVAALLSGSRHPRVAAAALTYRLALGEEVGLAQVIELVEGRADLPEWDKSNLLVQAIDMNPRVTVGELNSLFEGTTSSAIRHAVARVLRRRGDASSIPALLRGLESGDQATRAHIHDALRLITGRVVPDFDEYSTATADPVADWKEWLRMADAPEPR